MSIYEEKMNPTEPNPNMLSDVALWLMVCVTPLVSLVVLYAFGLAGQLLVGIGLDCLFYFVDKDNLKKAGYHLPDSYVALAIIISICYLFMRASKTNKNYAPFILGCVIEMISLFIMF